MEASCQFDKIIEEIKKAGFTNDSVFVEPNMFEVAVRNIKDGYNEKAYIKTVVRQYQMLISKYGSKLQDVYDLLENYFSNRDYIGEKWNRKFIRTIQAVLNSTKGKVGKGHSFFVKRLEVMKMSL